MESVEKRREERDAKIQIELESLEKRSEERKRRKTPNRARGND
jgi:hypothetical protein